MAGNSGTSKAFKINGANNFKLNIAGDMIQLDLSDLQAKPPTLSGDYNKDLSIIEKYICFYPDIAFEKIIQPQFDGIGKFTGNVSNQPDFIKDYHVISLMRCIDQVLEPTYKAKIKANASTPTFGNVNR